jgi:hypothetical protein
MKAIVQKPVEAAETVELVGNTLKALQGHVGGYITTFYVPGFEEEGITAWADDEGLLRRSKPNLLAAGQPIVGTVVFTGHDDEGGTIALTDEQGKLVFRFLEASSLNEQQSEALGQRIERLL